MEKLIYKIVFLGPQSSGKGTQAELLAKKLKLPVICMGNILRQVAQGKTLPAKRLKNTINQGKLVPQEITNKIVADCLKKYKQGFILDGYPRDLIQARFLDKVAKLTQVFEITLSDREAIKRISGRRSCVCGEVYHLIYRPPKKAGICDMCGKKLFIRADDQLATVKRRLKIYHTKTKKLIKLYQARKILIKVDGRPAIKKIHQEIIKKLHGHHQG